MKGLLNSGQGQMQGSCKHCNEPQFHKIWGFSVYTRNYSRSTPLHEVRMVH